MLEQALQSIRVIWKPVFEISILWFVIYHIFLLFSGTRAVQVLRGILFLVFLFLLAQVLNLQTLDWLLNKVFAISVIAALIIFHPEIRQGLARLGRQHLFTTVLQEKQLDVIFKQLGKATDNLCRSKVGALIAIEKNDTLQSYCENGVLIDAVVSSELIETIFTPTSILHDGAIIIQNGRIAAASCIFPLTANQELSRIFGTRHRAALGLSEETDAIIIVVSEERRDVSLVYEARLYQDLTREELFIKIKECMKLKDVQATDDEEKD